MFQRIECLRIRFNYFVRLAYVVVVATTVAVAAVVVDIFGLNLFVCLFVIVVRFR